MSEQIFLSHRRSDAWYIARLLKFYFAECGMTAFVDNQIDRSQRFSNALKDKIRESSDFVLLLTPAVVSRITESSAVSKDDDHVFWEMQTAYEFFKSRGTPKLHIIAYNSQITVNFSNLELPEQYKKYAEAFDHFKNLTSKEVHIDKFEGMSDAAILDDVKGMIRHLDAKPLTLINREVKASGYSSSETEEERLSHQSKLSYFYDESIMDKIEKELLARPGYEGKRLMVLDVGCANGKTGVTYFNDPDVYEKVLGIDIDGKSIMKACDIKDREGYENFSYQQMDITSKNFRRELNQFRQNVIGTKRKFDVIFCYQVLQHVSNRNKVLRDLLENLSDGGCLIIRGSDDEAKMFYNPSAPEEDNRLIEETVNILTTNLPCMADRYYGRKIYSDLIMAGLDRVTVVPVTCSTAGPNVSGKILNKTFEVSFNWRTEELEPKESDSEERKKELLASNEEINDIVERLRQYVSGGWYLETDFFGYGFKTDFI